MIVKNASQLVVIILSDKAIYLQGYIHVIEDK